eukprot:Skav230706  [mRNA]  locus=scaffold1495:456501:460644:- [translate_table: standard]
MRGIVLCLAALLCGASEILESKDEVKSRERRIIVRYASESSELLEPRVKRLEALHGISRAEALPSLDMAVVVCKADEDEDDVLEAGQ